MGLNRHMLITIQLFETKIMLISCKIIILDVLGYTVIFVQKRVISFIGGMTSFRGLMNKCSL